MHEKRENDFLQADMINNHAAFNKKFSSVMKGNDGWCVFERDDCVVLYVDRSAELYVCGFAAHSIAKSVDCTLCLALFRDGDKGALANDQYFDQLQGCSAAALQCPQKRFVMLSNISTPSSTT